MYGIIFQNGKYYLDEYGRITEKMFLRYSDHCYKIFKTKQKAENFLNKNSNSIPYSLLKDYEIIELS